VAEEFPNPPASCLNQKNNQGKMGCSELQAQVVFRFRVSEESMNTLSAAQPETQVQRYEALLRMAKALAVCQGCDDAAEVLERQLREVASFDYLHAVA
jgi:hypothetical protein